MGEFDQVRLIVEKEYYAKYGVHKGMRGTICYDRFDKGTWLVCFDEKDLFEEDPIIAVKETDLELIYSYQADMAAKKSANDPAPGDDREEI